MLLRREDWRVNAKRVWQLYREEGLQLRSKTLKRSDAVRPNQVWAMDFVHDRLFDGRKIRALMMIDAFTRLSPAIDVRQPTAEPTKSAALSIRRETLGTRGRLPSTAAGRRLGEEMRKAPCGQIVR